MATGRAPLHRRPLPLRVFEVSCLVLALVSAVLAVRAGTWYSWLIVVGLLGTALSIELVSRQVLRAAAAQSQEGKN